MREVTFEIANRNEYEIHSERGDNWNEETIQEIEARKRQAIGMFKEDAETNSERNTVFRVAQKAKLPVLVVREIEAELIAGGGILAEG